MKPKSRRVLSVLAVGVLTGILTACAPPATSSNEISAEPGSSPVDRVEQPETQTSSVPEQPAEQLAVEVRGSADCVTWQNYQTNRINVSDDLLLPSMPPGFEDGCALRRGMVNVPITYILRDGIALESVFDISALSKPPQPGLIPVAISSGVIDSVALNELIAAGDVITYYEACTTIGAYESNCAEYPRYRPYSLPSPQPTACFQGYCLQTQANIPISDLLELWEFWRAPAADPEHNELRTQYEPIDLDTLSSELQSAILRSRAEDVVLGVLGRTTLGEGEQPSVVTSERYPVTTYGGRQDSLNVISLVNEGLADDSIGGFRYRLEFEGFDGDNLLLIWAGKQQFCRRSQEWTTELCP